MVGTDQFKKSYERRINLMALTSAGFVVTVVLVDSGENESKMRFYFRSTDFDTIRAFAVGTLATNLGAVTGSVIKSIHISESVDEDAFALPAGVENENRALIVGRLDDNGTKNIFIPGAADGVFVAATGSDRNVVDSTDADLLAFLSMWQQVSAPGDSVLTLSDGQELHPTSPIKSGKRTHRASRKG